jgi:hypothetical protein
MRLGTRFVFVASLSLFCALGATAFSRESTVTELAPNFPLEHGSSLKSLRGKSVVVLVAPSERSRKFRDEVKAISRSYRFFAIRKTKLIAVFGDTGGSVRSAAPFTVLKGASRVAADFGIAPDSFGVLVIGPDGNIDLRSRHVLSAQRLIDAIDNSYPVQEKRRS